MTSQGHECRATHDDRDAPRSGSPPPRQSLRQLPGLRLRLRRGPHGYRWINTKRSGLPTDAPDDRALLAALIAHPQHVLGELPEDALHDHGTIHIDFHELVLVDRPAAPLSLLVAADDQSVARGWSTGPYSHGWLNRPTRVGG
ncbi:hypothetical protein [Streptomyces sp. NBC_00063]|uniref:hypothetical protein n=1 Tax=Streptomyces sp. NBC_00063 TaxID=2975638 RepID=UPI003D71281B